MKIFQLIALASLALFILGSCQKTKDAVDPPTTSELLIDGPWRLVAQTVEPGLDVGGTIINNEYAQLQNCEKDDNYNFTTTNTFTLDEGATKCDEADPQVKDSGSWVLSEDQLQITMNGTVGEQIRAIQNLTREELVLVESWTVGTINYTRTFNYEDTE